MEKYKVDRRGLHADSRKSEKRKREHSGPEKDDRKHRREHSRKHGLSSHGNNGKGRDRQEKYERMKTPSFKALFRMDFFYLIFVTSL